MKTILVSELQLNTKSQLGHDFKQLKPDALTDKTDYNTINGFSRCLEKINIIINLVGKEIR